MTLAGCLGTMYGMFCIGGAPRTKFLTELGATPGDFGTISALSSFALVFQIVCALWVNRLPRRKPMWMILIIAHRLVMVGVMAAPWLITGERARIWWIIGVFFLHDAIMNLGSPMWTSWMADLMPHDSVNRHWAGRQLLTTATQIPLTIFIFFFSQHYEGMSGHYESAREGAIEGYLILCGLGILAGVADILLFWFVPEPPLERVERSVSWRETISVPLRDPSFRPFLYFIGYWSFAAAIAWPFFTVYMIDFLKISTSWTQLILMAPAVGMLISSLFWGLLCDTYGQKPVLQMAMFGKEMIPLAFLLAPLDHRICIPMLIIVNFFDGVLNAAMMISTQGVIMKHTPRRNRAMYIAVVAFMAAGIPAGISSFLSGEMVDALKGYHWQLGFYVFTGYHLAFFLSATLRFGANYFVHRMPEPGSHPVHTVVRHLRQTNPLRVIIGVYRLYRAETPAGKEKAARRLGEIGSPLALRALIPLLQDPSRPVRHAAAAALGRIGMAEASEPLARALFDPKSEIQPLAAHALGDIGGADSLKALLAGLNRLDSEALGEAIDALGRIGDSAAMLPLVCLFSDVEDTGLRRRIAAALSRISPPQSAEEVMVLLTPRRPTGPTAKS